MTVQQAIHIAAEDAVRCRRLANDLKEYPLDDDGRTLQHAKNYEQKAEALETLIGIGRLWNRESHE
jgi:hypothetical protein